MLGVILKFDNWSKNIFKVLFKSIDISSWNFNINYWESYDNSMISNDYNELDYIDSERAKNELIYDNSEVYPEFLELFISKKNEKVYNLKTYNDFVKSSCFLSLVIIDHRIIEICCKDVQLLETIIDNFKKSILKNKKIIVLEKIRQDAVISAYRSNEEINIYDR